MQKVWMVWQTVDFGTDWLVGTFSTQAKADKAADDMFFGWLADRDMTLAQWRAKQSQPWFDTDDPFFVTDTDVQ